MFFKALAWKSGMCDSNVTSYDADYSGAPKCGGGGGGNFAIGGMELVTTTTVIYSVWDGDWAILEEYDNTGNLVQGYLQGYHGLVKTLVDSVYYYQDELGSTSHIASATGVLLEYYKYDLYGKPTYWSAANSQLLSSNYSVKDLFTGQRFVTEIGLYDDRNRFMSPDLGRFLQPDPIGFKGDASNLYRYCGNDWANKTDPMGLNIAYDPLTPEEFQHAARAWVERVRLADPGTIRQLERSGHEHFITQFGASNTNRPGETTPVNTANALNGRGTGTIIRLDPSKAAPSQNLKGQQVKTPGSVVAGHEFGHAADIDKGKAVLPPSREEGSKMSEKQLREHPSERNAVRVENKVRQLEGLQPRGQDSQDKSGSQPGSTSTGTSGDQGSGSSADSVEPDGTNLTNDSAPSVFHFIAPPK